MSTMLQASHEQHQRFEQDSRLLQQFVNQGSEAAFAGLVRRHLPFVYATCRRETGNPELAQDAAQVVFLLLARKADTLRNGAVLAAWLFQTARFTARDLLKKEQRRMRCEQQALEQFQGSSLNTEALWNQMEPLLNDALAVLSQREREAVLLRYMEGCSLRETGAALGMTENAARMRVARALEKMRRHLTKGGVILSASILAALLAESATRAASQVPEALNALVREEAGRSILQSLAAPRPAQLAQGVERTMKTLAWKTAATLALSAMVIFGGTTLVYSHARPALSRNSRTAGGDPAKTTAQTNLIVPAPLANLILPNSTLTFSVTSRDVRTPEMKERDLKRTRDGYQYWVDRGQTTQAQADQEFAQMAEHLRHIPNESRFNVTLSARQGQLLLLCDKITPAEVVLPVAYVYDGENSLTLFRHDINNEANVAPGMSFGHAHQLLPLPGLGFPRMPLFMMPPGESLPSKPTAGQTVTFSGQVPMLGASSHAPGLPAATYRFGELLVRWVNGEPQALEVRSYLSDTQGRAVTRPDSKGNSKKILVSRWSFSGQRPFRGVWLASRIRYTTYDWEGRAERVTEFLLHGADPAPLPDDRFVLENYLGEKQTFVRADTTPSVAFPFDARRGTLLEQIVQQVRAAEGPNSPNRR